MIDRLRSHRKENGFNFLSATKKNSRTEGGFTLIELLVVIAIIAILVVIAIVAINPIRRIRESTNDSASANVRSAASGLSACVTGEQAKGSTPAVIYGGAGPTPASGCGEWAWMSLAANGQYTSGNAPTNTTMLTNATILCAHAKGVSVSTGNATYYVWNSANGNVRLKYKDGTGNHVIDPKTAFTDTVAADAPDYTATTGGCAD